MRVDVSHMGSNALARYLFAAIVASGYEGTYYTGLYVHDPESPAEWRFLPLSLRNRLTRELRRRFHPGIPSASVKSFLARELPVLLVTRIGVSDRWIDYIRRYCEGWFDARVAKELYRSRPDVFIGHDGSLASLRTVKSSGKVAILNQVVGSMSAGYRILHQEGRAYPAFVEKYDPWANEEIMLRGRKEALEADHILVPSDYVRDTLLAEGVEPQRIALLPYGVDIERFRPGADHEDDLFRLLFVGQIGLRKGVPHLLEAIRRLGRADIELTMVGQIAVRGAALNPYRGLFRHIPRVPYHEVHQLYQGADAFVFPSLHEGSAFVAFEALASGLPVITTLNSGTVVRDGVEGVIIPSGDVSRLAEAISCLADDRKLRRMMALNARKRAEAFTWERYRINLLRILESCVDRL